MEPFMFDFHFSSDFEMFKAEMVCWKRIMTVIASFEKRD